MMGQRRLRADGERGKQDSHCGRILHVPSHQQRSTGRAEVCSVRPAPGPAKLVKAMPVGKSAWLIGDIANADG
jgi:hypothetical protein